MLTLLYKTKGRKEQPPFLMQHRNKGENSLEGTNDRQSVLDTSLLQLTGWNDKVYLKAVVEHRSA